MPQPSQTKWGWRGGVAVGSLQPHRAHEDGWAAVPGPGVLRGEQARLDLGVGVGGGGRVPGRAAGFHGAPAEWVAHHTAVLSSCAKVFGKKLRA